MSFVTFPDVRSWKFEGAALLKNYGVQGYSQPPEMRLNAWPYDVDIAKAKNDPVPALVDVREHEAFGRCQSAVLDTPAPLTKLTKWVVRTAADDNVCVDLHAIALQRLRNLLDRAFLTKARTGKKYYETRSCLSALLVVRLNVCAGELGKLCRNCLEYVIDRPQAPVHGQDCMLRLRGCAACSQRAIWGVAVEAAGGDQRP